MNHLSKNQPEIERRPATLHERDVRFALLIETDRQLDRLRCGVRLTMPHQDLRLLEAPDELPTCAVQRMALNGTFPLRLRRLEIRSDMGLAQR
jgi:hypothetical protein